MAATVNNCHRPFLSVRGGCNRVGRSSVRKSAWPGGRPNLGSLGAGRPDRSVSKSDCYRGADAVTVSHNVGHLPAGPASLVSSTFVP